MCQFNLILVKNDKNKKILENHNYSYLGENIKTFSPYIKGPCNCGSFVGSMSEYDGKSYLEMVTQSTKTELQRLNKIKEFMNQPNYMELKQQYLNTKNKISNNIEELFEPISNYELEQIDILEKKYKGKELQKQIEFLHKELDNKFRELENSTEFKNINSELNKFIEKNKLMDESTCYYLTKEEELQQYNIIPNEDLFIETESNEISTKFPESITLPQEDSLVIDEVINRLNLKYENAEKDFQYFKQLFEKLLENEEYILFSCIWNEPGKMTINRKINIKDIAIEDLASIRFNNILKIYK